MHDLAVLLIAFCNDIVTQLLLPIVLSLFSWIEHVPQHHAYWRPLDRYDWADWSRIVACKFAHQLGTGDVHLAEICIGCGRSVSFCTILTFACNGLLSSSGGLDVWLCLRMRHALDGDLIVAQTDANRSAGELKSIHLLQRLFGVGSILELHEPITTRSARLCVLGQCDEFELTKGFKDGLQIVLADAEVDVADVESEEGLACGTARCLALLERLLSSLSVLLSLGQLCDDRETEQLLSGQGQCSWDSVSRDEFNVADALGSAADAILDYLCIPHGSCLFKERDQLLRAQTRGELLNEDGPAVTLLAV